MFKNMKVGAKIIGGFSMLLVLLVGVAFVGYNGLSNVVDRADKVEDVNRLIRFVPKVRWTKSYHQPTGIKGHLMTM
jgi:CHASE3 domain sensor protein